jgi:hypothetical protein
MITIAILTALINLSIRALMITNEKNREESILDNFNRMDNE